MKNKQWIMNQDGQAVADLFTEKLTQSMRFFLVCMLTQLPTAFLKKIGSGSTLSLSDGKIWLLGESESSTGMVEKLIGIIDKAIKALPSLSLSDNTQSRLGEYGDNTEYFLLFMNYTLRERKMSQTLPENGVMKPLVIRLGDSYHLLYYGLKEKSVKNNFYAFLCRLPSIRMRVLSELSMDAVSVISSFPGGLQAFNRSMRSTLLGSRSPDYFFCLPTPQNTEHILFTTLLDTDKQLRKKLIDFLMLGKRIHFSSRDAFSCEVTEPLMAQLGLDCMQTIKTIACTAQYDENNARSIFTPSNAAPNAASRYTRWDPASFLQRICISGAEIVWVFAKYVHKNVYKSLLHGKSIFFCNFQRYEIDSLSKSGDAIELKNSLRRYDAMYQSFLQDLSNQSEQAQKKCAAYGSSPQKFFFLLLKPNLLNHSSRQLFYFLCLEDSAHQGLLNALITLLMAKPPTIHVLVPKGSGKQDCAKKNALVSSLLSQKQLNFHEVNTQPHQGKNFVHCPVNHFNEKYRLALLPGGDSPRHHENQLGPRVI